jgi:hypothetical protein
MIGWLRDVQTKIGLGLARLGDRNRKEGFWESLFRWWP